MGMDMYLFRARTKKQLEESDIWDKCVDLTDRYAWEEDDFSKPAQLWYGRKAWGLLQNVFPEYDGDMCGEYVEVNKKKLEEMIDYATRHRDYFGGFETVPALCQALDSYDDAREAGFSYFIESDW